MTAQNTVTTSAELIAEARGSRQNQRDTATLVEQLADQLEAALGGVEEAKQIAGRRRSLGPEWSAEAALAVEQAIDEVTDPLNEIS